MAAPGAAGPTTDSALGEDEDGIGELGVGEVDDGAEDERGRRNCQ